MENKKRKSTGLLLSILGVISLVLITAGVTYAFFSYAKQGEKENTITTGSITFIYNETSERLNISDALPKADSVGMQENANNAFTFTVTSTTPSTAYINYIVTARMDPSSTLPTDQVKLYLTSTLNSGNEGTEGTGWTTGEKVTDTNGVKVFSALDDVTNAAYASVWKSNTLPANTTEKVIYAGQVPTTRGENNNYVRTFKMNMWLKGAEEVAAHCSDSSITTQEACVSPAEWIPASQNTNGMADYSAYEFVKKSVATTAGSTALSIPTLVSSRTAQGATFADYNILTSVEYYSALESAADRAAFADQYERIALVNYNTKQIYTVSQLSATGFTQPSTGSCTVNSSVVDSIKTSAACAANDPAGTWVANTENWQENEQYYPFNGGTFKVTINVYAEGATTYTVPTPANSGN